jgi:hypothetical protein
VRARGLSLAEVIFSGVLALVLCLAVLSAFPTSLWAVTQSENLILADGLAQSALDKAQARPFAELELGVETPEQIPIGAQVFERRLEIFEVPEARPELLKGLRVTVSWEERGGSRQAVHELWISGLRP